MDTTLHIPYLKKLATMEPASIKSTLAAEGTKVNIDKVNWPGEFPYRPEVNAYAGHDETRIYILFDVNGMDLRSVNTDVNSSVHQDSCVEFFVCPTGEPPYFNFEFNCIGTPHVAKRLGRHDGSPLDHQEISRIGRYPSLPVKCFEEKDGEFHWDLLVSIPIDLMGLEYTGKPIKMRGNFYKCADLTAHPHFLSWLPIATDAPDFHRPEYFGDIILD